MGEINAIKFLKNYECEYKYFIDKSKSINFVGEQFVKKYNKMYNLDLKKDLCQRALIIKDQLSIGLTMEENYFFNNWLNMQKVEKAIDKITQPYKTILYLKYLRFFTFLQIANKMNYSVKRIYQLHKNAIVQFNNVYE